MTACDVFVPEKGDLNQPCLGSASAEWKCKEGLECDKSLSVPTCVLSRDGGTEDGGTEDGSSEDGGGEDGGLTDGGDELVDAGGDGEDGGGDEEPAICDNFIVESGEDCEAGELQGATCLSQGYSGGDLACDDNCQFDYSGCETLYRRVFLPEGCTGTVGLDWIGGAEETNYLLVTCEAGWVAIWSIDATNPTARPQLFWEEDRSGMGEEVIGVCFGDTRDQLFSVFCQGLDHTSCRLALRTRQGDGYGEVGLWELAGQKVDLMRCATTDAGLSIVAIANQADSPAWVGVFIDDDTQNKGSATGLEAYSTSEVKTLLLQAPAQDPTANVAELAVGLGSQEADYTGALRWSLAAEPFSISNPVQVDSGATVSNLALSEDSSHLACSCESDPNYLSIHDLVEQTSISPIEDFPEVLDMHFVHGGDQHVWLLRPSSAIASVSNILGTPTYHATGIAHGSDTGRLVLSADGLWLVTWADMERDEAFNKFVTIWNAAELTNQFGLH